MKIVVGTRRSALAQTQTALFLSALKPFQIETEVKFVQTIGDIDRDRSLADLPQRGVFTKALEESLLRREIDIAVHSAKDLPVEAESALALAACLPREDPRDVFISFTLSSYDKAGHKHRIGTGSERRRAFLPFLNPLPQLLSIRGNVDTRIRKCREGKVDGIVLAAAGVRRLGLASSITQTFSIEEMLPSPGQGAVAIQCRQEDLKAFSFLSEINDEETFFCVETERALLAEVGGGCQIPFGTLCQKRGDLFECLAQWAQDEKIARFQRTFLPKEREELLLTFREWATHFL